MEDGEIAEDAEIRETTRLLQKLCQDEMAFYKKEYAVLPVKHV